jgi:hypothetical protein
MPIYYPRGLVSAGVKKENIKRTQNIKSSKNKNIERQSSDCAETSYEKIAVSLFFKYRLTENFSTRTSAIGEVCSSIDQC